MEEKIKDCLAIVGLIIATIFGVIAVVVVWVLDVLTQIRRLIRRALHVKRKANAKSKE